MSTAPNALFRLLPSVDEVLRLPGVVVLIAREGQASVTEATRAVLDRVREEISGGRLDERGVDLAVRGLSDAIERELARTLSRSLRPVVNATGVVLHTNMGRAPLSQSAIERITETAAGYSNLEFDLRTGERGKRDVHAQRFLFQLLNRPGESGFEYHSIVVNNCAAAVLLALNALAEGGEVIVSRGELVEIGGSFRVPEVMAKSGAVLREVGTTNRTRLADYESAINDKTRLILRVHRSNFAVVGFTEQPSLGELVELGRAKNIPVLEDLGNGAWYDLRESGIDDEPGLRDSLRAGADVVTYSGDKLFGGPQAGIISGRQELVARIRKNPMFRAFRADKLTYAALEATLADYLRGQLDAIPALRMLRMTQFEVLSRAEKIRDALAAFDKLQVRILPGESIVGGGTTPGAALHTFLLSVAHEETSAESLLSRLRNNDPPVIARVDEGRVLLDLRTVFPQQDAIILVALKGLA